MRKLGGDLKERLNRSAFFLGAVLFHLVLLLMIVGYVVFPSPAPEQETGFPEIPPAPAVPPTPVQTQLAENVQPPAPAADNVVRLQVGPGGIEPAPIRPGDFVHDEGAIHPDGGVGVDVRFPIPSVARLDDGPWVDLDRIQEINRGRQVDGRRDFLRFPIYLAKYADGDWDCNNYVHQGQLDSGALPNLMAKIHEWSNGELDGRQVKVVALDSPELVADPPPFLFFTGHRDFRLTSAEIENLRNYLQIGGAIWGDSAFAGDGSRFDMAFHREMRRVLPDADLAFQPIPANHDIFSSRTKFTLDAVPPGMNRRADPIEGISLAGKIAVLYTPNDYGDMMTMLLQPGRNEDEAQADEAHDRWMPDHPLFTPARFSANAAAFYRNYEPASVMTSCKLSMNILIYLLHRYDDELLLKP